MKKYNLILAAVLLLFIIISCKHSSEPENNLKDPREMRWTIDTLYYPDSQQTLLGQFAAINSKNIYTFGHCGTFTGSLYWYNGENWVCKKPSEWIDKMLAISPFNIWAFTYYDGINGRWAATYKYDGTNFVLQKKINGDYRFNDAYTDNKGKIFACGWYGLLFSYDGITMKTEYISLRLPLTTGFQLNGVCYYNNKLYLNGASHSNSPGEDWSYFIVKEGDKYILKDSVKWWPPKFKWGTIGFYNSPWGKFYSYGYGGLWEFTDEKWVPVDESLNGTDKVIEMFGISPNYYFLAKNNSKAIFCNGVTQIELNNLFNINLDEYWLSDIWTDGKEVFIGYSSIGSWPMKTIILHGK